MIYIHLEKNEETVLAIVRELYLTHKKRLPLNWIYNRTSKEGMPNGVAKIAIRNLSFKKMIYSDGPFWKPKFNQKQEQAMRITGIPFNLSKIMNCIKKINKPSKPSEILMQFIELYGTPDDIECFLDYIRTLGEDPTSEIVRDYDNNYKIIKKFFSAKNTKLSQFSTWSR